MSDLTGDYICLLNKWLLSLKDLGDGKLACSLKLGLNKQSYEETNFVTLEGNGSYYNKELFNIGLTACTSLANKSTTITSGWSGYQVNKDELLQLNLEGVITCLVNGKVVEHTCLKYCLFEKIINDVSVSIFLDADYIVENSGTGGSCSSPLYVKDPNKCIYMVSDYDHEITGHGHAELNIQADPGEGIIWRAVALDFGSGKYCPYFYQFVATSGEGNIGDIKVDSATVTISRPKTNHDNAAKCDQILTQSSIGQISARVLRKEAVTYHIRFMLVEPTGPKEDNFEVVGYYYWDPYINFYQ